MLMAEPVINIENVVATAARSDIIKAQKDYLINLTCMLRNVFSDLYFLTYLFNRSTDRRVSLVLLVTVDVIDTLHHDKFYKKKS